MTSIFDQSNLGRGVQNNDKPALETHPEDLATFWTPAPEGVCATLGMCAHWPSPCRSDPHGDVLVKILRCGSMSPLGTL